MKSVLQGADKSAIVGSLKDLLYKRRMERQLAAARGLISGPELPPMEDGEGGAGGGAGGGGGLLPAAGAKGGYVPPSVRNRGATGASMGESMHRRGDDNSVRVTNLSEDTREDDLRVRGEICFSPVFLSSSKSGKKNKKPNSLFLFSLPRFLFFFSKKKPPPGPLLALRARLARLHRRRPRDGRVARLRLRQLCLPRRRAACHRQAGRLRLRQPDPEGGVGRSEVGEAVKRKGGGKGARERGGERAFSFLFNSSKKKICLFRFKKNCFYYK